MDTYKDRLAKKYARAWINLFVERLDIQLIENIDTLSTYLHTHRSALFYVQLTALDNDGTRKNFEELLTHFGVGQIFQSLINLLIEHKRIYLLPRLLRHVYRLYLEEKNIMHFTIESAVDLTKDELVALKVALAGKTGKNIICHSEKNTDLIAGLKVYSETLGFERSIRKQLRALSRAA